MTPDQPGDDPSPISIEQDCEIEEDGEVGGPLAVFWAEGHGHDPGAFIHAVVEHCLDWGRDIPRIDAHDPEQAPAEVWQTTVSRGDSVIYRRAATRDGLPPYTRAADVVAVTVLDLDARSRGAPRCSVRGCPRPFRTGVSVAVCDVPDPPDGPAPTTSVDVWLCRAHQSVMSGPSYRMALVPVGAEIVLPNPENGAPDA